MLTFSSHAPAVHALVVQLKDRLGLISLSKVYEFELRPKSKDRTRDESIVISVRRSTRSSAIDADITTASFSVIYGENGCGKTHLMLEACRSLANVKGQRHVGVIWGSGEQLWFDPGSQMKRRVEFADLGGVSAAQVRSIEHPFPAVFYTTSPFENGRRFRLESRNVYDVTPSFSSDNPFDGVALLRAYGNLPKDFEFIDAAESRMRIKIPSLRSVIERLLSRITAGSGIPGEIRSMTISRHQRRVLMQTDNLLEEKAKQALVIELLSAEKDSIERVRTLLASVADQFSPYSESNENALLDADLREKLHNLAVDIIEHSSIQRFDTPNTLAVRYFLIHELVEKTSGIGKKAKLSEYSTIFEKLNERDWEMLRHASSLGLIKWSFKNLSSGQIALLFLFSALSRALNRLESAGKGVAFLFIDEGEMFMHPKWQRRYIVDLLEFLAHYPVITRNLHVVISTHSMIVAADSPPKRLFDVKTGEMNNGFGYGPNDLLGNVYRVEEFQGENAGRLMQRLVSYLLNPKDSGVPDDDAAALAAAIADKRLKAYMVGEVRRRIER